jgi:hypothetical protein
VRMFIRQFAVLFSGTLLVLGAGCEKSDRKPVFPVRGRLTVEGKPIKGVAIHFVPVNANDRASLMPVALTDADGRYVLMAYQGSEGAPAGEYIVALNFGDVKARDKKSENGEESGDGSSDKFRDDYTVSTSKLRATVKPQPNEIDFAVP